ncbi:MAG: UvrD-helicase domain-containing protein [Clostridia bacterium]|nr:UvrD-helicase domain-containing protein [Clostridia bacterium]
MENNVKIENIVRDESQERVINHTNGNILVSASAGSGKTYSMIKRLINLIVSGKTHVKDILAVTFTESAAKEMKEKLARAITEEIINGNDSLADEISDLPYADVCTIDSFCARIVRLYFYKVDVSPDFSVADAAVSDKLKSQAMDRTFREFYNEEDSDFLLLTKRLSRGRKDDSLKETVMSCYEYRSTEIDLDKFKKDNLDVYSKEGYEKIKEDYLSIAVKKIDLIISDIEKVADELSKIEYKDGKGYEKGLETAAATIELLNSVKEKNTVESLFVLKTVKGSFEKNADEYATYLKDRLYELMGKIREIGANAEKYAGMFADESKFQQLKSQTETFYRIIERFEENYAQLKAEEKLLDFNDLERYAQTALKDEEVAKAVRDKYKYVFVDEYQDVNGIQEDIITSIANDNLFMVGDVKQSIYGFRGCRSDFFTQKFNEMVKTGNAEKLKRNFRSAKNVINGVNKIFGYSMTKKLYGEDYYPDNELIYGEKYDGHEGRFNIYVLNEEKEDNEKTSVSEIYDVLKAAKETTEKVIEDVKTEARFLATIINNELNSEYYDIEEKRLKKISYGDIAILSRNGIEFADDVVKGLEELGIPVTFDGETSILDYSEIAVLTAFLKTVDNFNDDVSLATTMKGLFGFTDEDLATVSLKYYSSEIAETKGKNFYSAVIENANLPDTLREKVNNFKTEIEGIRSLADFITAGEVLQRIVDRTDYYAMLMATDGGEDKVARVKFFIAKASDNQNYTVREFIELIESAPKAFKAGGGGGDAVKFVTIHSSKGLEYPVVIVRNADKKLSAQNDYSKRVLTDRKYGFALKYYDDENYVEESTPLTEIIKERIKDSFVSEELRLFYVALTRAKYSLNIAINKNVEFGKLSVAGKYSDFIPDSISPIVTVNKDDLYSPKTEKPKSVLFYREDEKTVESLRDPIPEDEDCNYEIAVNKKDYKTRFSYSPDGEVLLAIFGYHVCLYYDNLKNRPHGEDL